MMAPSIHSLFPVLSLLIAFLEITPVSGENNLYTRCDYDSTRPFSEFVDCWTSRRRVKRQYSREPFGHPCHTYVRLNQPERRTTNLIERLTDSALCDRTLRRRWYRFDGPAGGVMPTTCVQEFSCGTHAPIWMNGKHPDTYGKVLDREVCVSLGGHCCSRRWYIRVANCGEFYTYLLTDTPGCFMAYCAGDQLPCPEGQSSPTGFSPGCSANYPTLRGKASLSLGQEGHKILFFCDWEGPIPVSSQLDVEWYVLGEKAGDGDAGEFPVWTDTMIERRRSVLTEGRWMGKMGSTVQCNVRAKWTNRTGVPSPAVRSEKFFAGIKVSDRVVTVSESSGVGQVALQATVPVQCLPQFDGACGVTVQLAHDQEYATKKCVDGRVRQVVFGDCNVRITPDNWRQPHNVTVKAVRDFYNDGNKNMRVNFKPIFSTLASPIWNNYQLPEVEVVSEDGPTRMCASTGDPHYNTFDGLYYHLYIEGEFVLYKHNKLPIQINTRLEKCGNSVSCNCGVAVRAADDVIVIDRCSRRDRKLAFGRSFPEGWRSLHRHALQQGDSFVDGLKVLEHDGGRRYTVHLPTGAYIDFHVGERWINLYLYASSEDVGHTAGLCGTFDGDTDNDLTHPDGTMGVAQDHAACGDDRDVCKFAEAWRVSPADSYFGAVVEVPLEQRDWAARERFCKCEDGEDGAPDVITCNYHYDVHNCAAEREREKGQDRTDSVLVMADLRKQLSSGGSSPSDPSRPDSQPSQHGSMSGSFSPVRHRRSAPDVTNDDIDDYFNTEFVYDTNFIGQEPTWPTPSGITEWRARNHCIDLLMRSPLGQTCKRVVFGKLNSLIDSCMTDIKVTDDLSWAQSAVQSLSTDCAEVLEREGDWEEGQHEEEEEAEKETQRPRGREGPSPALLQDVCHGGCSMRGDCVAGSCVCHRGFTGEDCGVRLFDPPKIIHLPDGGVCDVRERPCRKVRVYGTNFRDTDINCRFEKEEGEVEYIPAVFETFEEITCPLPEHGVKGNDPDVTSGRMSASYRLSVVQDNIRGNTVPLFVHDSGCLNCSWTGEGYQCDRKPGVCVINGYCYVREEHHPNDCCRTCDPTVSDNTWLTDTGSLELRPYQTTYELKRSRDASKWRLNIEATDTAGRARTCGVTYSVAPVTPSRYLQVLTSHAGVTLSVSRRYRGSHYVDVAVRDQCGGTAEQTYSAFVLGMARGDPGAAEPTSSPLTNVSCTGNRPPRFPYAGLSVSAVHGEMVRLALSAADPDEPRRGNIEFYVLKNSSSSVGITKEGELTYVGPTADTEDHLTVIAQDTCGSHGYMNVVITTGACPCKNGGLCQIERDRKTGSGSHTCECPPDLWGRYCDQSGRGR